MKPKKKAVKRKRIKTVKVKLAKVSPKDMRGLPFKKKSPARNLIWPGRPNYEGPNEGWFAFVHHGILWEHSFCIDERVRYIRKYKPQDERQVRLRHLLRLPRTLGEWCAQVRYAPDRVKASVDADVLAYAKKKLGEELTWNGRSLCFTPGGAQLTG